MPDDLGGWAFGLRGVMHLDRLTATLPREYTFGPDFDGRKVDRRQHVPMGFEKRGPGCLAFALRRRFDTVFLEGVSNGLRSGSNQLSHLVDEGVGTDGLVDEHLWPAQPALAHLLDLPPQGFPKGVVGFLGSIFPATL